jgi:NTP pyrophosphatase (non-canonical NTP hydrolase)
MNRSTITLAELQAEAIRFRDERDWAQFHAPKDLALGLTVEAGELAELFLWKSREQAAAALGDAAFRRRLGEELADVQVFLLYLAEAAGLDLAAATRAKIAANALKYPVEKARGSAAKYTEL